jgi:hypothetical protein
MIVCFAAVALCGCNSRDPASSAATAQPAPGAAPVAATAGTQQTSAAVGKSCPTAGGVPWTVVELAERSGRCEAVTNGAEKFEAIWTRWGSFASWIVCNRCSSPVDVKIRDVPPDDFVYTVPQMDGDNAIVLENIGPNSSDKQMYGLLHPGPDERVTRNYNVSWRLHGTLAWTNLEPRLEIERDNIALWNRLLNTFATPGRGPLPQKR